MTRDFFRPKKPTDDACDRSFNGKAQAECIDQNWFLTLGGARPKRDAWVARFVKKQRCFEVPLGLFWMNVSDI